MHCKNAKTDNHGFTLVEVLIAIIILAIVVAPFLHLFVTASRTNLKARTNLRATTAAQDIMEGLKADTIEDLTYQFNFPNVDSSTNPLIKPENDFHIIRRSLIHGDVREVIRDPATGVLTNVTNFGDPGVLTKADATASMYSEDNGVEYEFLGQSTGRYCFVMEDVTLQNTNFDALIELDATPYRGPATDTTMHNSHNVVDIMNMNNIYDAIYIEKEADTASALQTMNINYYDPNRLLNETEIRREITIDVEQNVVGGNTVTTVLLTYEYFDKLDATHSIKTQDAQVIFNNTSSQKDLQDVYLFYFPIYNAGVQDKIVFNNDLSLPVTFHIVKQEPLSTIGLEAKESSYHCDLYINETGSATPAAMKTLLRSNLDTNLQRAYDPTSVTANNPLLGISYYFNGSIWPKSDFVAADKYENLPGDVEKDRIFDIRITVFEAGAYALGFPADDRLTVITGSTNN